MQHSAHAQHKHNIIEHKLTTTFNAQHNKQGSSIGNEQSHRCAPQQAPQERLSSPAFPSSSTVDDEQQTDHSSSARTSQEAVLLVVSENSHSNFTDNSSSAVSMGRSFLGHRTCDGDIFNCTNVLAGAENFSNPGRNRNTYGVRSSSENPQRKDNQQPVSGEAILHKGGPRTATTSPPGEILPSRETLLLPRAAPFRHSAVTQLQCEVGGGLSGSDFHGRESSPDHRTIHPSPEGELPTCASTIGHKKSSDSATPLRPGDEHSLNDIGRDREIPTHHRPRAADGCQSSTQRWSDENGGRWTSHHGHPTYVQACLDWDANEIPSGWYLCDGGCGSVGEYDDQPRIMSAPDDEKEHVPRDAAQRWHDIISNRVKKTVTPRTPQERALPLHRKSVALYNAEKVYALISQYADLKTAWDEMWTLLEKGLQRLGQSVQSGKKMNDADLEERDIQELMKDDLIAETTEDKIIAWVRVFCVLEVEKGRKRAIFWPKELNELIGERAKAAAKEVKDLWPSLADIINPVLAPVAGTTDLMAFFHQIPIPAHMRPYFTFRFKAKVFECTTIPTGICIAPFLAQILITAISRQVIKETQKEVTFTNFVDNIRFCERTQTKETAVDSCSTIMRSLKSTLTHLNITWNERDTKISQSYDFLGVTFDHESSSVRVGRSKDRLIATRETIDSWTLEEMESTFAKCIWGSRILNLKLAKFYHIFKFVRRRLQGQFPGTDQAKVWPSIKALWKSWISECCEGQRLIIEDRHDEDILNLFTDASEFGWGAVLFSKRGVYVAAGRWSRYFQTKSINVKETQAVVFGREAMIPDATRWKLFIDNTSALYGIKKGRSKVFSINAILKRIDTTFLVSAEYIKSNDNPSDCWSRGENNHNETLLKIERCIQV